MEQLKTNVIVHGDSLEYLRSLPANSVDSVVTDPPYGISFMAKGWDSFDGNKEYAQWVEQWATECLRILKPGGHLLAFSGTRTYHALAWGVESAGFEIRDMIEWLYLSGFPKSMDVGKQFDKQAGAEREVVGKRVHPTLKNPANVKSRAYHVETLDSDKDAESWDITAPSTPLAKQWDGWGTALKPAHEPIVMARKPLSGTVCANVEQYGTGAINVDGCRIDMGGETWSTKAHRIEGSIYTPESAEYAQSRANIMMRQKPDQANHPLGRFPANCITTDDDQWYSKYFNVTPQEVSKKASKSDRNSDWLGNPIDGERKHASHDGRNAFNETPHQRHNNMQVNHHPTVKPVALMEWLIRLVTPPDGIVLDPFAGSGTTLVAAKRQGYCFIGVERELDYVQIAETRLS